MHVHCVVDHLAAALINGYLTTPIRRKAAEVDRTRSSHAPHDKRCRRCAQRRFRDAFEAPDRHFELGARGRSPAVRAHILATPIPERQRNRATGGKEVISIFHPVPDVIDAADDSSPKRKRPLLPVRPTNTAFSGR
jgi:hypothetical protein